MDSIEYGVALVQFRADDEARDGVRSILIDNWTDVSRSSRMVIACMNKSVLCSLNDKWMSRVMLSTGSFALNGIATPHTRTPLDW